MYPESQRSGGGIFIFFYVRAFYLTTGEASHNINDVQMACFFFVTESQRVCLHQLRWWCPRLVVTVHETKVHDRSVWHTAVETDKV